MGTEDEIDEERVLRLGYFLRIGYDIGLPSPLPGLERYMAIEHLKGQLSRTNFYYFDFSKR